MGQLYDVSSVFSFRRTTKTFALATTKRIDSAYEEFGKKKHTTR
jgi:hypothetical protein